MAADSSRADGTVPRRGVMLVLSSPSGAGKSTIARNLLQGDDGISLSISVTTREKRRSEVDGIDYHFISKQKFLAYRDSGQLLEWAEVHGNYYGTPLEPVQAAMAEGRDMLFDVDWQGALQMFDRARSDIASIFILPPDMKELRSRLVRRAEDTEAVIEKRLENSRTEMKHWNDYDYVVVNDNLDRAFSQVRAILKAERVRRERVIGLNDFVTDLLQQN